MNNPSKYINNLIEYAYLNGFIKEEDKRYCINKICDLINLDYFQESNSNYVIPEEPSEILLPILDYAVMAGLITPDTIVQRDIFEAKIIDILLPKPSEVINQFNSFQTSQAATNYYYNFSKKSNYIKTSRTSKNIIWKSLTKYGELDMTINLSKPEKDPKDIIAAGNKTTDKYPKCLLCKENVGYNGKSTNVGRTSHRIIPIKLNNEDFYLQYSPYVYYNEHCIVLHKEHIPMNVTINTFKRLLDFVDKFPHYFLGSNAGLPIVGGSILSHEHYQGGNHYFPIAKAKVLSEFTVNDVLFQQLYWPLSVVRLKSTNKSQIIEYADVLYKYWESYTDESAGIYAFTNDIPHNAITPIARTEEGIYYLDITLRNNRTSTKFPLGIFHPHPENHHIKKENIGLIEVMGLAVLPARLVDELQFIKEALVSKSDLPIELEKHKKWFKQLQKDYRTQDINTYINDAVAHKFMNCIEDSGVFKQTEEGYQQFTKFMEGLQHALNKKTTSKQFRINTN